MDKINFQNGASGNTPLNATNLNKLQDNIETAVNGTILYEDKTGTIEDVPLSETCVNFNYLEIYLGENCNKVKSRNGMTTGIFSIDSGSSNVYVYMSRITLKDTTIQQQNVKRVYFPEGSGAVYDLNNLASITKVIGYK